MDKLPGEQIEDEILTKIVMPAYIETQSSLDGREIKVALLASLAVSCEAIRQMVEVEPEFFDGESGVFDAATNVLDSYQAIFRASAKQATKQIRDSN